MSQYHINPETGRPNKCYAKIQCRFGKESKHYDSKEDARAGYEKDMADEVVSKSLKKNPGNDSPFSPEARAKRQAEIDQQRKESDLKYSKNSVKSNPTPKSSQKPTPAGSTQSSQTPKPLPIIPGVPKVPTESELNEELEDLKRESLYGNRVKDLLQWDRIGLAEIEELEKDGEYYIDTKVPSYYEIGFSTDLARRELGLPPRKPTGVDQTPIRLAEVKMKESLIKTRGEFQSLKEVNEVNAQYKTDKYAYDKLAAERSLELASHARFNADSSRGADAAFAWYERALKTMEKFK